MVFTATYEAPTTALPAIGRMYRTTSGGTVFSEILYNATAFDYFANDAVVNDALYISTGAYGNLPAGLRFTVGTAFAADSYTLVWEYYKRTVGWVAIEDIVDNTVGFSVTGTNDVKFPQQWQPNIVTIQGLSTALWVRCRITAVNHITEGGANITNTVKYSKGTLTISGTSDETPGTFTQIYDWLVANQPHISVYKRHDSIFDFTRVGLVFNQSRVYTTNEVIEIGQDCLSNCSASGNNFRYLTSGIKKNDTTGYGGSTFIVHGVSNSGIITTGAQTKMYGTTMRTGKNNSDGYGYAGYVSMTGEWIDCNIELSTQIPPVGSTVSNVRFVGNLLIAGSAIGTYSGVSYLFTGTNWLYCYRVGFTLPDLTYVFKGASGAVIYIYQASANEAAYTWKLTNPSVPLTTLADAIKPLAIGTNSIANLSKVWYYDASAGTYTDYTSQASDVTANDVPLSGDVGDMYYFGMSTVASASVGMSIYITKPTVPNDYVYTWEYYYNGAWQPVPTTQWDETNNLSNTGGYYFGILVATNISINSVSLNYLRATITSVGTGTPTASTIKQKNCSAVNNWNLKEAYTFDLTVYDEDGNVISGADVTATDENGAEIFKVTTGGDGKIAQQEILAKWWYFDPINNPVSLVSENIYTKFDLLIEADTYMDYVMEGLSVVGKKDLSVSLTYPIYYEKALTGAVTGTSVSGGISSSSIEGAVTINSITGVVDSD